MRVHRQKVDQTGAPKPVAFQNKPTDTDGMSTDWEKYSTPQQTRQRARKPEDNIVISLVAGDVRAIEGQRIEHEPIEPAVEDPGNRAHTEIFGEKTTEARVKFMQIWKRVDLG